jgi:hypothetical protein
MSKSHFKNKEHIIQGAKTPKMHLKMVMYL